MKTKEEAISLLKKQLTPSELGLVLVSEKSDPKSSVMYAVPGSVTPLPCYGIGEYSRENRDTLVSLLEGFYGVKFNTPIEDDFSTCDGRRVETFGDMFSETYFSGWEVWREWLVSHSL